MLILTWSWTRQPTFPAIATLGNTQSLLLLSFAPRGIGSSCPTSAKNADARLVGHHNEAGEIRLSFHLRDTIHTKMEREAAIRLLRALVAVGLRQRESMANAAIRSVAVQAGLDEFDAARQYARQQGWLVEAGKDFSTMLTPAGWRAARGE
jgi:hypothetical protein